MFRNLVSPVLVGREAELAALTAALESRGRRASPRVVLVGGEAGVGKTRLVEEAADARARGRRARALGRVRRARRRGPAVHAARRRAALADARHRARASSTTFVGPGAARAGAAAARARPDRTPAAPRARRAHRAAAGARARRVERLAADRAADARRRGPALGRPLDARPRRAARARAARRARARGRDASAPTSCTAAIRCARCSPAGSGCARSSASSSSASPRDEVAGQLEAILGARAAARAGRARLRALRGQRVPRRGDPRRRAGRRRPGRAPAVAARRAAGPRRAAVRAAQRCCASRRRAAARCPTGCSPRSPALDERELDAALREAVEHHVLVVDETGRGYVFRHTLDARRDLRRHAARASGRRIHAAYARGAVAPTRASPATGATVAAALALHWYGGARPPARAAGLRRGGAAGAPPYAPAEALRHLERALEMWPQVPDAEERCGVDVVEVLRRAGLRRVRRRRARALARAARRGARRARRGRGTRAARAAARGPRAALLDLGAATRPPQRSSGRRALLPAEPPTVARAVRAGVARQPAH